MKTIQRKSCALWPEGVTCGENPTHDYHPNEAHAKAVCDLLSRIGFGGDHLHFPVKTWVEKVES
jgi:hypothetical protein